MAVPANAANMDFSGISQRNHADPVSANYIKFVSSVTAPAMSLTKAVLPVIRQWLLEHFEPAYQDLSAVVSREYVYSLYLQFTAQTRLKELPASSLGKIVKATFPNIRIKRLCRNGSSKYHYAGLREKKGISNDTVDVQHTISAPTDPGSMQSSPYSLDSSSSELCPTQLILPFPQEPSHTIAPISNGALDATAGVAKRDLQRLLQSHSLRLAQELNRRNFAGAVQYAETFWRTIPPNVASFIVSLREEDSDVDALCRAYYSPLADCVIPRTLADTLEFTPEEVQSTLAVLKALEDTTERALGWAPVFQKKQLHILRREFSEEVARRYRLSFASSQVRQILQSRDHMVPLFEALYALKNVGCSLQSSFAESLLSLLSYYVDTPTIAKNAYPLLKAPVTSGDALRTWSADAVAHWPLFQAWRESRSTEALHEVAIQWTAQAAALSFEIFIHCPLRSVHSSAQLLLVWLWQLLHATLEEQCSR